MKMDKMRKNLIDALTAGENQVTGVLVAYQMNGHIAEQIAGILPYPVKVMDSTKEIPPLDTGQLKISHVIELYHPGREGYGRCKELRKSFWNSGYQTLSLYDWQEEYLEDQFWGDLDYPALAEIIAGLMARIHQAKRFKITSPQGTDISFSTEGRRWLDANGIARNGNISQMPDGEVYTCPVEETFNGVIVVDGTVTRSWVPTKPVQLEFSKGQLVRCSKEFEKYIKNFPKEIKTIGEFAIGLNPDVHLVVGNISVDEKAAGTVHFALGDSYGLGKNKCDCHLDFVVRNPVLQIEPKIEIPFMKVYDF